MAPAYGSPPVVVSTSTIISKNPSAYFAGVLINSCAATTTIQFYDDLQFAAPVAGLALNGIWTPGAIVIPTWIPFGPGIICQRGLVVVIAVSTCNLSIFGRF